METPLHAGEHFIVPTNGVFMTEGRYKRYRDAINDRILEEESRR